MRNYVSDAGPLISFERIPEGFSLLRRLARAVVIPQQVYEELAAGIPLGHDYLAHFGIADFVEVVRAPGPLPGTGNLHDGECYAIALASARRLPLLIEERHGHAVAERLGLTPIGSVGLLLDGLQRDILTRPEAERSVQALFLGKRINRDLLEALLKRIRAN